MYDDNHPKRPFGFGFRVKQSQLFGLEAILRKERYGSASTPYNCTELEFMKAKMLDVEKENQELRSMIVQINARADQSNQIMLQTLRALRTGKVSDEDFDAIQSLLSKPNSQVPSAASVGNGLKDLPFTSNSNVDVLLPSGEHKVAS